MLGFLICSQGYQKGALGRVNTTKNGAKYFSCHVATSQKGFMKGLFTEVCLEPCETSMLKFLRK